MGLLFFISCVGKDNIYLFIFLLRFIISYVVQ